jgi:small GTP-binding protein
MKHKFTGDYKITIGVDVSSKNMTIDGNKITFSVNDIAGQQRFESLKEVFFRGAHLALLVFDVTRKDTLTDLRKNWVEPIIEASQNKIFSILVGNKCDLEDLRVIEPEEGKKLIDLMKKAYPSMNIINYLETSALENKNVEGAFEELAKAFISAN